MASTAPHHCHCHHPSRLATIPLIFYHIGTMSHTRHRKIGCVCNWGPECLKLKTLLDEAGDVLLTRMISIKRASSETSIALRSVVKHHFKLGPEHDDTDFHIAAHHWAPLLMRRNYEGSTGTRVSPQFRTLLTKLEATSCCCSMEEPINNFESCVKRAGVSISKMDKRRLLLTQGPPTPCLVSNPILRVSLASAVSGSKSARTKTENHWQFQRQCHRLLH
jgi:hypothetical protein